MNRYRIAEIAVEIDDNGEFVGYSISRAGKQIVQGGFEFGYSSESYKTLQDAIMTLEIYLTRDEDDIISYAKNK